jgi:D-glycero-D-manno-heptose 1,7-bisphosphate phosphatase
VSGGALPDAVFLDRDGTINAKALDGRYVTTPAELELLDGAAGAISVLNERGVRVIVVTNQRGITLGAMSERDLERVHRRLADLLADSGAHVDAIYHCPHGEGVCTCRKPDVGLFLRAAEDFPGLALERSAVVGDTDRDIEAGRRIGATTVRIFGSAPARVAADHDAASLQDAVEWLLARGGPPAPTR